MKITLISLTFLLIFTQQQTIEQNAAYFNFLKESFNSDNFYNIYNQFHSEVKALMTYQQLESQLIELRSKLGNIDYWVDATINQNKPIYIVAFTKNLAVGEIIWNIKDNQLYQFVISDSQSPSLIDFIQNNPQKTAFTLIQDGTVLVDSNGDRAQPLQSVLKIPIAIEFSRQVTYEGLNQNTMIPLDNLNKFYMINFDNAHQQFLEYAQKKEQIVNNEISLQHITEGMIMFSSNCNTEFLQTYLTVEKIQNTIVNILKLQQSDPSYLVSSILAFYNYQQLKYDDYIKSLEEMTMERFFLTQEQVHQKLISSELDDVLADGYITLLDPKVLGIQANYVTASTTNQYANLMYKLNIGEFFNDEFYAHFYPLIGIVSMSNPVQAADFEHSGVKGGGSALQNDTNCMINIASFGQLRRPYPQKNTALAILTKGLDYKTDYLRLLVQFNSASALMLLDGYFNLEVQNRFEKSQIK